MGLGKVDFLKKYNPIATIVKSQLRTYPFKSACQLFIYIYFYIALNLLALTNICRILALCKCKFMIISALTLIKIVTALYGKRKLLSELFGSLELTQPGAKNRYKTELILY